MITTAELTEDANKTAVAAAIDLVRSKYPSLDLRAGTALRSLVIEPAAMLDAMQSDTVSRLRTAMSLKTMANESSVPREDAEAVLSNFGISLGGGTKSSGLVRVNVTSSADVTVRAGVRFVTDSSFAFVATDTVTASVTPADGQAELISSEDGRYYFVVPVEAEEVGSSGNILQGKALTCSTVLGNYYSSEAFSDFTGGEDGESVASAVARIPSALAYRGMTNSTSVRAQLSSGMSDSSLLRAVSCVGYRDKAQLRDKHNAFGISVGGRVDVYARLFDAPGVVSFIAEGTLENASKSAYRIKLPDYPGFYAVRYVGLASQPNNQGSLQYELTRDYAYGASSYHDFDFTNDASEAAWSRYQTGSILVYSDSDNLDRLTYSGSAMDTPAEKVQFKVDLFWTDGISGLQDLVDGDEVRNVAADYVVRSPAICLVSMAASVRMRSGVSTSETELADAVSAYVNGRSFVQRLSRSEIANVLLQNGAESVDLSTGGMQLGGRICGADGNWYYFDGDTLDVGSVSNPRAMISAGTVVFAAEPGSIQVTKV